MVKVTEQPNRNPSALDDEVKRRTQQLAVINKVADTLSQQLDLKVTLQAALEAVLSVIPVDASGISLVDEQAGELVMRAQHGWYNDFVTQPMRIKLGTGLSGHVVSTGEVVVTGDPSKDPRHASPSFAQERVQAQVLAPMHARGKVIGVLSVTSHQPYDFSPDEINVLRVIADQVGLALDNAQLYERVKEQQSKMLAVLQSTADAIIAVNSTGQISLLNYAAERLFNLNAESHIGQPIHSLRLPSTTADRLFAIIEGQSSDVRQVFEVQISETVYLSGVVSPVYSQLYLGEQRAEGWVVVFQDITHLKEAERARLQFIQTAAHDLRNPLGVTLSALTMLSKTWKDPTPTDHEVFSIAMNGINRMQDLIDDLLNLEKIDSGVDVRFDPVSILDIVERCTIDMRPVLAHKNQTLDLDLDMTMPELAGDGGWLYRALMNYVSNAHKYAPEGTTITIHARCENGNAVIEVEDQGPGIPYEAQGRLFERFYRVPGVSHDQVKGTGLGLAIVKSVAEKHNGTAYVISEPGKGCTFGMRLPFQHAA
ncbi:MAG TPA: ATP-binding protein [Aggregatilineales bacterium]|nr:ATP-binding protein [Aggregatilineales bacterium]